MPAKEKFIVFLVLILMVVSLSSCLKTTHKKTDDPIQDEKIEKKEEEQEKESHKEEIDEPVIVTPIDYAKYQVGQLLNIKKEFVVYTTAADADKKVKPVTTYLGGEYYVYKVVTNAINLSKSKLNPGGWTDLNEIGEENVVIIKEATTVQPPSDPYSSASKKVYNWSWGYPDSSGKSILENNNGLYKKYNEGEVIYLTFDNGYEYNNITDSILDILAENQVKAVFFVTGSYIKNNQNLVLKMINGGHIVANHSQNHKNHAKVSVAEAKEDILKWEETFQKYIGALPEIKLYRPPSGAFSETSLLIAKDLGYKTVLWAYAYQDWDTSKQPDVAASLTKLLKYNQAGNVVLLHAVSTTNLALLDDYLKLTIAEGFQFKLLN